MPNRKFIKETIQDRQKDLDLKIPNSICIAGCGGVGSNLAIACAQAGIKNITIYDDDIVEIHNKNRTMFFHDDIGKLKVNAIKNIINKMDPDIVVNAYPFRFDPKTNNWKYDVMVDCTDKFETQKLCCKMAKEKKVRYIRLGLKINHYTVTSIVPEWGKGEDEQCGVTIPAWGAPAWVVVGHGMNKILRNFDLEKSEEI